MSRPTTTTTTGSERRMGLVPFLLTFLCAWAALDRLVPSPPLPLRTLVPLAAAGAVLVAGELLTGDARPGDLVARLGLGRPEPRAMVAAIVTGGAVVATLVVGALLTGATLRANWPAVLVGALLFHGVAEELVWRGFALGHLRRRASFWGAVARSVPLIALTHVPIIFGSGIVVGTLAVISAAVTCLPFSYLWERGGHTIWAPAVLHGLIGTWQVFERPMPDELTAFTLVASIVVPLVAFAFGDRFFTKPATRPAVAVVDAR